MAKILDGKKVAQEIQEKIKQSVETTIKKGGRAPHLAAILVGTDGASQTYVNSKVRACKNVGFESTLIHYPTDIPEKTLLDTIKKINEDDQIDGLIVQLPLPKHIAVEKVIEHINPKKDVDGFHPINVGRMTKNLPAYIAATPLGILKLLDAYEITTQGKHCVIVGRSHIVGSPMSILMANPGNATVTLCHRHTIDLKRFTQMADILIVAVGIPEFIKADMIKKDAVIIDVGITRVPDPSKKNGYSLKGDVHFQEVSQKASYITPVPKGVGPMTITALLWNTLLAAKNQIYAQEVSNPC